MSTRQHYKLATGESLQKKAEGPPSRPQYAGGGAVKKNAGGAVYHKGGKKR